MLKTLIVLPDGTELFSGAGTANAIQEATITECVNEAQELALGSTCANMVEAKIITPKGGVSLTAGDEIAVYKVDDLGNRYAIGLFTTEEPTRPSANSLSITAYDRISWLDKDLSTWLKNLKGWPYRLYTFATMVCEECGLVLKNAELPNEDYRIQAFSGEGITGRQLLQWVGQIAGRFCRATTDGLIEFAWYTPVDRFRICAVPKTAGINVEDPLEEEEILYYQNGLSFEDYTVAPIQKVQLQQNAEDVGTVYPPDIEEAVNTYAVTGNYLLTANTADDLVDVAQTLYEHLKDITYNPCKVSIPARVDIHAGNIIQITDKNGKRITAYVMTKTTKGQKDTLECTGSMSRGSSTAMNNKSYAALTGKVLNLRADVEGLKLENADTAGNLAKVNLDLEGIKTQVVNQQADIESVKETSTSLRQSAEELELEIKSIRDDGVNKVQTATGYSFSDEGLKIRKEGQEMENLLDHTGMYVKRNGQTILQANSEGVEAHDVSVRNFLIVGTHARFEDYGAGRTACYYWEES